MSAPDAVRHNGRVNEHTRWSGGLISRRRPIVVAVALAVLSIPVVTIALLLAPEAAPRVELKRLALGDAILLAAMGTLSAAVVGGSLGGILMRRGRSLGTFVAIALAWPVGVAVLPIAANALGVRFEALEFCLDACNPLIRSELPLSGAQAYVASTLISAMFVVPLIVALVLRFVARALARRGAFTQEAVVIVAAYAGLNWAIVTGGVVTVLPFLALAIGVVLWARLIDEPA